MQNIMEELLTEASYLDPYLRQFLKYIQGKNLLSIGTSKEFLTTKIQNMGYNVHNLPFINNEINNHYDGIILFNTLNEIDKSAIPSLFENIYPILNNNGYIFIVISYHKNANNFSKEYIDVIMETNFNFVEELSSYDNLKFYIYAKNTIK